MEGMLLIFTKKKSMNEMMIWIRSCAAFSLMNNIIIQLTFIVII